VVRRIRFIVNPCRIVLVKRPADHTAANFPRFRSE
jgi:hypothetical protein